MWIDMELRSQMDTSAAQQPEVGAFLAHSDAPEHPRTHSELEPPPELV